MPYSKKHKAKTKELILASAESLFGQKGFESVSVNEIMESCSLTRGAFYAHFVSKSQLYSEALQFSAKNSRLVEKKPSHLSKRAWLDELLDGYLSVEHVRGERPCPLAFMSKDIVSRNKTAKKTYRKVYENMNNVIIDYLQPTASFDKRSVYALTSMIIGAVAIGRTLEKPELVGEILSSARAQASRILEGG